MKNDEILIIKYPYRMSQQRADILRKQILEQKESGVILLHDFCSVVTAPKDMDIQVELEKEDDSTPWQFIDNLSYSSLDPASKEWFLFCDGCGITIEHWDAFFKCCPYCGKKHTFDKEDKSE